MDESTTMRTNNKRHWKRVTKYIPCPICNKPDWCLIHEDGKHCICARIESEREAGRAGWLHLLKDSVTIDVPLTQITSIRRAEPAVLDTAYRSLLSVLSLSPSHHQKLRNRGLSDSEIEFLGYKTLPWQDRNNIGTKLQLGRVQLSGVPGFYWDFGKWRLSGPSGIAIPIKNVQEQITGIQIRCDQENSGKYKWLSSSQKNYGCSPGTPIHVAGNRVNGKEVWITEGALKADVTYLKLGQMTNSNIGAVMGISGVGNWQPTGLPGVLDILKNLQPKRVIVSFDMDRYSNTVVQYHLKALITSLLKNNVRTLEANWNHNFKGIDDLLTERT